jgi:hypothetical protein
MVLLHRLFFFWTISVAPRATPTPRECDLLHISRDFRLPGISELERAACGSRPHLRSSSSDD